MSEAGEESCADSLMEKYLHAGHPETCVEDLWLLAVDEIDKVRRRVAENPLCPRDILFALAIDDHPEVRIAVAEHPEVPPLVLDQLAHDDNADVRYALAENPNLPESILSVLTEDENPYVAHRAQRTLRMIKPSEVKSLPLRQNATRRQSKTSKIGYYGSN